MNEWGSGDYGMELDREGTRMLERERERERG